MFSSSLMRPEGLSKARCSLRTGILRPKQPIRRTWPRLLIRKSSRNLPDSPFRADAEAALKRMGLPFRLRSGSCPRLK